MKCLVCNNSKFHILRPDLFDDRYGASGKYSVFQCKNCSFGQTNPRLKKSELPELYSKYYPLAKLTPQEVINSATTLGKIGSWLLGVNNVAHQHIRPHSRVLDIGSGSGVALLEILDPCCACGGIRDPILSFDSKKRVHF